MAPERLNRDQFFEKLAEMDVADLKKALWTLYWRGAAPQRERIEALIDPTATAARDRTAAQPDPKAVLAEVTEFVALARSGAYLSGDRRVSGKQRSQWRHTFRQLSESTLGALRSDDVETAGAAVAALVDLACETKGLDYFRSQDPMEAARFVVSDAVAMLWSRTREALGADRFIESATGQLVRWESQYGWTRVGMGWVSERETSLAQVLAGLLVVPDQWTAATVHYLEALDRVAEGRRDRPGGGGSRTRRAQDLSEWHALVVDRLVGSDHEQLLDRLVAHSALAGPELRFAQARLAHARGGDR